MRHCADFSRKAEFFALRETSMARNPESRTYDDRDLKLLWGLAAARCSNPKCHIECVAEATETDRAVIFGKIAHIVAHSDAGPRADPSFPKELRRKYENLILLCGNHHDVVDGQDSTYTIGELRAWKSEHEQWVRVSLAEEISSIGFAELEVVAKAILSQPSRPADNLTLTPPAEKMLKNQLTEKSHFLISMGLSKAREVAEFVGHVALRDGQFPERLKAGFLEQYQKQRALGIGGDDLFSLLHQFASGYSYNFRRQAAGLAVLAYLFEKCEVFEH